MFPTSPKDLRQLLVAQEIPSNNAKRRAAVAIVLRYASIGPEVLLMRRAERESDRWSGQVSFPGGKEERADDSLLHTAIRETEEELGFSLNVHGSLLGKLPPLAAVARHQVLDTKISPFVFEQTREPSIEVGVEASHAFWLPLVSAFAGTYDDRYQYKGSKDSAMAFPCYRFQGEVIWGLTYRMLQTLRGLKSKQLG